MTKDLDSQLVMWNKNLTNYYNPKKVVELKYYSRNKISFKLYIRKEKNILDDNFKEFFKIKENSSRLGYILKTLTSTYKYTQVRGSYFKGFFNCENWHRFERDFIEYEYFLTN